VGYVERGKERKERRGDGNVVEMMGQATNEKQAKLN
jgi:hypothetical protein